MMDHTRSPGAAADLRLPDRLPDHPAFLRLSGPDGDRLFRSAEIWSAPARGVLYHAGDSGEDLLLLLSGRLETDGGDRLFPGDLWGADRLARPRPLEEALRAVEPSLWMLWPRQTLLNLVSAVSSLRKSLAPLEDRDGRLLSGLPEILPVPTVSRRSSRRIRKSLRPLLAGLAVSAVGALLLQWAVSASGTLPAILPLAAPALFAGWALVFLLRRLFIEYSVDSDALMSRSFSWAKFAVESRRVPVDRIQGVEVERIGILRRLLGFGTVIVKTSALEGELVITDVRSPEVLADEIRGLGNDGFRREEGRQRESVRRSLEGTSLAPGAPKRVRSSLDDIGTGGPVPGERQFRKSPAVLAGKLVLPLLIAVLPVLGADVIAGLLPLPPAAAAAFAVLPLFWALYRFEDWRNDSFRVSGGYAVDLYRKPLGLRETRRQVDLVSVQNIRTEQKGLAAFLFRYGDVILVTAGGASDTVFTGVSRPWRVQEALFSSREEGLRRQEERIREARKDDMLRFVEALDQIREN